MSEAIQSQAMQSQTTEMAREAAAATSTLSEKLRAVWRMRKTHGDLFTLYIASCFIDLGLCLYFFLFSLFLVEHSFPDRIIGYITSALTLGTLCGSLGAGALCRRLGLRAAMLVYIVAVPLCLASRTLLLQNGAQIGLAFASGMAMSIWFVCFSPALASLTTERTRTLGFSIFMATGIGSGAAAGVIGGTLPGYLSKVMHLSGHGDAIRVVLLMACGITALAAFAIFDLRIQATLPGAARGRILTPFFLRFLFAICVWNFAISFFTPFANVYLSRSMSFSLARIGGIYTCSQIVQVAGVLVAPLLFRRAGLVTGIAITQLATGVALWSLSRAHSGVAVVIFYLLLTSLQWMSGPGISSLLMTATPEGRRSQTSAAQFVAVLAAQAASAALAGRLFSRFGYSGPLLFDAALAATAAALLFTLLRRESEP